MNDKCILDDSLRNKITQLEYKNLSNKEKEIKEIYKKHTGEKFLILKFIVAQRWGLEKSLDLTELLFIFMINKEILTKSIIFLEALSRLRTLEMLFMIL